ncbi:uncharacterized protein J4E92_001604 [Alternaria infectoria]|uniref:uncharacterized protein n=1 Tax=Alternaria infectoria TaxID=45303 RepID=UPI00221FF3D4|nr:uncharacterized protein J4E92_001604 [Alternaria infectoria]KAI4936879.1 hypothetical protein J4E92_001604 [Alternaria infectoria]
MTGRRPPAPRNAGQWPPKRLCWSANRLMAQESAEEKQQRLERQEVKSNSLRDLSWNGVVTETGWMDPTAAAEHESIEIDDEEALRQAFELVGRGAARAPDTARQNGLDFPADPKNMQCKVDGQEGKQALILKDYQRQTCQTIVDDYKREGSGMILGLEMGLGKTVVTLDHIKKIDGVPHLMIVPASLMATWEDEINDKMVEPLKYCMYHEDPSRGHTNKHSPAELRKFDVVFASYEKLLLDAKALQETEAAFNARVEDAVRCNSTLAVIHWHVIGLEEGHRIANALSKTTNAAYNLQGLYRMPITGTPFQNEYSDLQSLFCFMGTVPWNSPSVFARFFSFKESQKNQNHVLHRESNAILALAIKACTIRIRTTDNFGGLPVADYKPAITEFRRHKLTFEETQEQESTRTIWDEAYKKDRDADRRAGVVGSGSDMEESVFASITTARLAMAHPACTKYRYGSSEDFRQASIKKDHEVLVADIGNEMLARDAKGNELSKGENLSRTRLCAETKKTWAESSRMEELIKVCKEHRSERPGPVLVFAEFLSALDVAKNALEETFGTNTKIARIDGTVKKAERQAVVDKFKNTPEAYDFILITARCGGLGLTLIGANCVIHLTPLWNPHLQEQCTARAVRIGQTKQVYVYVLHAKNSIENHVLDAQRTKKRKAVRTLDPDDAMRTAMDTVAGWSQEEFTKSMTKAKTASKAYADKLAKRKEKKQRRLNGKQEAKDVVMRDAQRSPQPKQSLSDDVVGNDSDDSVDDTQVDQLARALENDDSEEE